MKRLLLILLCLALGIGVVEWFLSERRLAQQITVEQIPAKDMLSYIGIDPNGINSVKFSVAFPSKKFAALETQEKEGAKMIRNWRTILPLEPYRDYGVEVVVLPFDRDYRFRGIRFKLSSGEMMIGGSTEVQFRKPMRPNQLEIGASIPTVLKYTVGSKTYTISLLISDTPISNN